MTFVKEGEFFYGDDVNGRQVYIDSFYIDIYEITNIDYNDFVRKNGYDGESKFYNNKNLNAPFQPVVGIDWYNATEYCRWKGSRLPKDTEWEKAAGWDAERKKQNLYPWGSMFDINRLNTLELNKGKTTIVGHFIEGKSFYGLYDMAGNVWEWISDWYEKDYLARIKDHDKNPDGAKTGQKRIVRGGSWGNKFNYAYSKVYVKGALSPDMRLSTVGFRCVKDNR